MEPAGLSFMRFTTIHFCTSVFLGSNVRLTQRWSWLPSHYRVSTSVFHTQLMFYVAGDCSGLEIRLRKSVQPDLAAAGEL